MRGSSTALGIVLALAACGDDGQIGKDAAVPDAPADADTTLRVEVALIPAVPNRDIDLLFVVDDSPSTLDKQNALKVAFPAFVNDLSTIVGGLPRLHLGVVTSDVGTKGELDTNPGPSIGSGPGACAGTGKAGVLQNNGTAVTGLYISDLDGTTNFSGTLPNAFSELASVGANGCGFEQTLAAARLALTSSTAANAGFLRAAANLAVVILSDEDDCSMSHSTLMGSDTATLGPLQSFRCTRFGITCDQGGTTTDEMNQFGSKDTCHSNEGSAYLSRVADYVTFFKGLKTDPRTLMFGGIIGNPTPPLTVEPRSPPGGGTAIPALAHSCAWMDAGNLTSVADPGVRLSEMISAMPHGVVASVCSADLTASVLEISRGVRGLVGVPCLEKDIKMPPDCIVTDIRGTQEVTLPACGGAVTTDCYTLVTDGITCPGGQHIKLDVTRTTTPASDWWTSVRCAP